MPVTDALHTDALTLLSALEPSTPDQEALQSEYLQHLTEYRDGTYRECAAGHLTASALVWQRVDGMDQVLLTLHARIGRWLQLGGHMEPADGTVAAAALREAREESGIGNLRLDPAPVRLDRHRVRCRTPRATVDLDHLDVQFLALALPDAQAVRSAESSDLRWFSVDDGAVVGCSVDASVAALVRDCWERMERS